MNRTMYPIYENGEIIELIPFRKILNLEKKFSVQKATLLNEKILSRYEVVDKKGEIRYVLVDNDLMD